MTKFVIGIGSQRAGSTLLSKVLEECTSIFSHPIKELHYYDTLFQVRHSEVLRKFSRNQLKRLHDDGFEASNKRDECFVRANRLLSEREVSNIDYIDLFRPCIQGNEYLCEITPEYMILPEEGVARMRDNLGRDAKIILLARNPTQRFISSVKLLKSYGGRKYDSKNLEQDILNTLERMPDWVDQQDRLNDYQLAYERFGEFFDDVLLLAYDDLFKRPLKTASKLQSFLDVPFNSNRYLSIVERKVNGLGETGQISEKTITLLNEKYTEQISFLNDFFGKDILIS